MEFFPHSVRQIFWIVLISNNCQKDSFLCAGRQRCDECDSFFFFVFVDSNWKCNTWNYFRVSPSSILLSLPYLLLEHCEITGCLLCPSSYESVTVMLVGGITAAATLLLYLFALKTNVSINNALGNYK